MSTEYRKIGRKEFLEIRAANVASAEELREQSPGTPIIVVDPGDEIICDYCNALVTEDPVQMDRYGLVCLDCRNEKERYAKRKKNLSR